MQKVLGITGGLLASLLMSACQPSEEDAGSTTTGNDAASEVRSPAGVRDAGDGNFASADGCIVSAVLEQRFIELVNAVRAQPQQCGDEQFPAVGPVTWSERLESSALAHSQDMAVANFFSHFGSDGSHVGERATAANYRWTLVTENVAAGFGTPESAMIGWMNSPGHCRNIMDADVTEMGVSCADDEGSDFLRYWTQVFAAPSQ